MKKITQLILLALCTCNLCFGQTDSIYAACVKDATIFYHARDFQKSANKYKEAFDQLEGKAYPNDRYNAACSYALAGDSETAFYHLFRLANAPTRYQNYNHITVDADLNNLHKDPRWNELISLVKANKEEAEKDFDKPLVAMLDTIYMEDQQHRLKLDGIEAKYGLNSSEEKAVWDTINTMDSINLIRVRKILDEHGWLGPNVIGQQGNMTLFLVIQHADPETRDKYLPMMRDAVKQGNANANHLALLEDRSALDKGNKQIYGSQITIDPETGEPFVSPLIDPDNVDHRRAEVGLGPLQDYISHWGLTWNADAYKKKLPEYENRMGR
ncbi:MAG: hypothetical protein H6585_03450 [Flavobacteriales bacterium]|nr:hypothetical protein [Flavobacteriales bacterium]MCB9447383.1 hypothetical protein [Flavobacteriales bacterium]